MTVRDRQLNSMSFQAWKMKSLNFMTFQVFHDLYEPCIPIAQNVKRPVCSYKSYGEQPRPLKCRSRALQAYQGLFQKVAIRSQGALFTWRGGGGGGDHSNSKIPLGGTTFCLGIHAEISVRVVPK